MTMFENKASKTLDDMFCDGLKDIYYAENKILKGLEKMMKGADCAQLRAAFEKHYNETQGQIQRLERVFALIDKDIEGKKCDAIEGILKEGEGIMKDFKDAPAMDAGLVASAQAVEHYEIARYGTLKSWAELLGLPEAASLLDQSLQEEMATDQALTHLAEDHINQDAVRLAAE